MGTVQAAVANGVLDAVRSGDIPRDRVNDLGILASIWLDPAAADAADLGHTLLFRTQREAMAKAIRKAMRQEPSIDWLLEHQEQVVHYYHQLGVDGQL
jgi:5,6,7,8-tetrahydromethanopterin hydro-lyase